MNKKIIASLATIAVVGAAAIGGTIAYFSDQQVSTGNIIQAGTIDLEINHSAQTYNGIDCEACVQEVVSGTDDMIVAKYEDFFNVYPGLPTNNPAKWSNITPVNAIQVNPYAASWNILTTGTGTETIEIPWVWKYATPSVGGANQWFHEGYRFQKSFDWNGPTTTATVALELSADNTYNVKMNGVSVSGCQDLTAATSNYTETHTCSVDNIQNGQNILEIEVINVRNWSTNNPAGLTYKLTIDGNCNDPDSYFGEHCALWQTGDFANQKFFDFDDVKPGDWGTNKISLTVTSNDANVCMYVIPATTTEEADTALANYIKFNLKYDGSPVTGGQNISLSNLVQLLGALPTNTTKYVDVEWCFGAFDGQGNCDGTGNQNDAQGGKILADLGFYAEQTRHNGSFACPSNPFAAQ
jgi:predicted ribosomally synthesized peptide with SipW-like signal peptide